jgi:hypothetical protein
MIRWRVANVIKGLSRNGNHMRLANFESMSGFDTEWKLLRRPTENSLPNLAPLGADWNFGANRSTTVAVRID